MKRRRLDHLSLRLEDLCQDTVAAVLAVVAGRRGGRRKDYYWRSVRVWNLETGLRGQCMMSWERRWLAMDSRGGGELSRLAVEGRDSVRPGGQAGRDW